MYLLTLAKNNIQNVPVIIVPIFIIESIFSNSLFYCDTYWLINSGTLLSIHIFIKATSPNWTITIWQFCFVSASNINKTLLVTVGSYKNSFHLQEDVVCTDKLFLRYMSTFVMCQTVLQGRFVSLTQLAQPLHQRNTFLELCEIQIFGEGVYWTSYYY